MAKVHMPSEMASNRALSALWNSHVWHGNIKPGNGYYWGNVQKPVSQQYNTPFSVADILRKQKQ